MTGPSLDLIWNWAHLACGAAAFAMSVLSAMHAFAAVLRRRMRFEVIASVIGAAALLLLVRRGEIVFGFSYTGAVIALACALSATVLGAGLEYVENRATRQLRARPVRKRFVLPIPGPLVGSETVFQVARILFVAAWFSMWVWSALEGVYWGGLLGTLGFIAAFVLSRPPGWEDRMPTWENLNLRRYRLSLGTFAFLSVSLLSASAWSDAFLGLPWPEGPKFTWMFVAWLIYVIDLHLPRCEKGSAAIPALGTAVLLIALFGTGPGVFWISS